MSQKKILSGMRPTGELHLGHLVGALNNWVKLQWDYKCFFMIADWHALMSEYKNSKEINDLTVKIVAHWLSCGIDPDKSTIFIQSDVKEHLELNMILSAITPLGWLRRNPTYKEQIKELKEKELETYAFLGYPVLQASDILIYKADSVPVGKDQLPHLEISRKIARRFNNLYRSILKEPQDMLTPVPRLKGLDNRKMSKSYDNYIALADSPEVIREKVNSMFTDPERIKVSDPGHPEECNVFDYYKVFKPDAVKALKYECKNAKIGCVECKKGLAEVLIQHLSPIREKQTELLKEQRGEIKKVLQEGAEEARAVAGRTLSQLKEVMGLR